jgi:DNA-binding transcriptional LysR family regulator
MWVSKWGLRVKMNLDRFNLNLFVAFEALSKADTLTQAAGELYVTQSTLSVALRQMREYFDDELFVYKPKQKELTPLAEYLRPRILEILTTAKAALMLKEETARFARGVFAGAKSQRHVPRRAFEPTPLELDRRC